jgi:sortase B
MENRSKLRIVQYAVLIVCAVVFVVCAVFLVKALLGYTQANSFYDDMTAENVDRETAPPQNGDETPAWAKQLMDSYMQIKAQYPNVVGYIHIPSVGISYPTVQGEDNEYYMTHLVSGQENKSGSIFLDFRIDTSPLAAKNLVLYGHNMNDKSMFHNVRDLFDEQTFLETRVEYVCDDGVFVYDALSIYVTDTSDIYYMYDFYSDESYAAFFDDRAAQSRFSTPYDEASHMITLVTCTNSITNPDQRYIFHGMLTEAYTEFEEIS